MTMTHQTTQPNFKTLAAAHKALRMGDGQDAPTQDVAAARPKWEFIRKNEYELFEALEDRHPNPTTAQGTDLAGDKIGVLKVIHRSSAVNGYWYVRCRCQSDCNRYLLRPASKLIDGTATACGNRKADKLAKEKEALKEGRELEKMMQQTGITIQYM